MALFLAVVQVDQREISRGEESLVTVTISRSRFLGFNSVDELDSTVLITGPFESDTTCLK